MMLEEYVFFDADKNFDRPLAESGLHDECVAENTAESLAGLFNCRVSFYKLCGTVTLSAPLLPSGGE